MTVPSNHATTNTSTNHIFFCSNLIERGALTIFCFRCALNLDIYGSSVFFSCIYRRATHDRISGRPSNKHTSNYIPTP